MIQSKYIPLSMVSTGEEEGEGKLRPMTLLPMFQRLNKSLYQEGNNCGKCVSIE
jgi:hypothetical protein